VGTDDLLAQSGMGIDHNFAIAVWTIGSIHEFDSFHADTA
jgi:hypothetical protein